MKLSKEAQGLFTATLARTDVRTNTEELIGILAKADQFATQREESSVSKSTMADALDAAHFLDAETLGCADAYAWADEANRNYSTTFGIECFSRISEGLDKQEYHGQYLKGWARGVFGFAAALKRGRAIGKRVA